MSIVVLDAWWSVSVEVVPWGGLGCEAIVVRWLAIRSWKTSRTYGMCRSECKVWLVTYHGAFVIVLRSLDWYRWSISILEFEAQPHNSQTDLWKSSFWRWWIWPWWSLSSCTIQFIVHVNRHHLTWIALYLLSFTPHRSTGMCYVDSILPLAILIHAWGDIVIILFLGSEFIFHAGWAVGVAIARLNNPAPNSGLSLCFCT